MPEESRKRSRRRGDRDAATSNAMPPGKTDPHRDPCDEVASEWARHAAHRVQQMLLSGLPQDEILAVLVKAAEQAAGKGAVCSILMLDRDGLLRNAASPNLPADYIAAIDGLKPDPRVGTCAAAAATGAMVVTPDFQADDKWAELRHLPLSLGFHGAWSTPIKGSDGRVLGTFGTYFRERRSPTSAEVKNLEVLAGAAGLVLETLRTSRRSEKTA